MKDNPVQSPTLLEVDSPIPVQLVQIPWTTWPESDDELLSCLDETERARWMRYRTGRRRRAFLVGRVALRRSLSAVFQCHATKIPFTTNRHGKPMLSPGWASPDLTFNVAHSGSLVVIAWSRAGEIGIDVEDLDESVEVEVLLRNYFSESERRDWQTQPHSERRAAFFRGWTRKEAAWKCYGDETRLPWQNITVPFDARSPFHAACRSDRSAAGEKACTALHGVTWQPAARSFATVVWTVPHHGVESSSIEQGGCTCFTR